MNATSRDIVLHLRDLLLDRVLETVGDVSELGLRRSTRSSDDGTEDRGSIVNVSQEDIQVLVTKPYYTLFFLIILEG